MLSSREALRTHKKCPSDEMACYVMSEALRRDDGGLGEAHFTFRVLQFSSQFFSTDLCNLSNHGSRARASTVGGFF